MTRDLVHKLEAALAVLASWRSRMVTIDESISRACGEDFAHDRHFATLSRVVMQLEHVGWAFSGGAVDLAGSSGTHQSFYQLTIDLLDSVEIQSPDVVIFVEQFGETMERRSTIRRM